MVIRLEIRNRPGLPIVTVMDRKLEQNRIILSPFEPNSNAKLISDNSYVALEAPDGAPEMSPERVKEILSEL